MRDLTLRARQLAAAQRTYSRAVPPTLARTSRVIGFERHVLTVGADNSAIAAKLRQLAPHIVQNLQGDGMEVTGILVKVQVSQPTALATHSVRVLNEEAKHRILELAANLDDSPLKRALQRLITHNHKVK